MGKRKPDTRLAPTPQREARNPFRSVGMARRIIPMIDMLAERGTITAQEHRALAYYRDQASLADRSPIRSCCDNSPKGGGHGPGVAIMSATLETARIEKNMGNLRKLARAIAVDDWSLSRWCVEQYGGRERYDGKGKLIAIVPVNEKDRMNEARSQLKAAALKIIPA